MFYNIRQSILEPREREDRKKVKLTSKSLAIVLGDSDNSQGKQGRANPVFSISFSILLMWASIIFHGQEWSRSSQNGPWRRQTGKWREEPQMDRAWCLPIDCSTHATLLPRNPNLDTDIFPAKVMTSYRIKESWENDATPSSL